MSKCATRAAYGKALAELIQENERVVVLDADLAGSTKTIEAKKVCPSRHFDMGIAEGNMMSVAAGFAASGKIPYVSSFAMFACGRAYEQIRNSIAYPKLNVKICATHAGISVGEDGASHQCIEDLALMRAVPHMIVLQPCDERETRELIHQIAAIDAPCYVRLGRDAVESVMGKEYRPQIGKGVVLQRGSRVAVLASGRMVQEALKAKEALKDILPTIVNIHTIKPIDEALITELAATHDALLTAEDHSVIGGLGSAVSDVLTEKGLTCRLYKIGVRDTFGESGKPDELLHAYHMDAEAICQKIKELWQKV